MNLDPCRSPRTSRACPMGFCGVPDACCPLCSGLLCLSVQHRGTERSISSCLCVPLHGSTHAKRRWAMETCLEIFMGETLWHHCLAMPPLWSVIAPSASLSLSLSSWLLLFFQPHFLLCTHSLSSEPLLRSSEDLPPATLKLGGEGHLME